MTQVHKRSPDQASLYRVAENQAGYFTASQAIKTGYSWDLLTYHSKRGRFQRVARGIYRLGQFPSSPIEDLFVAWLRCGPKAIVSHESALALYDLSDLLPGEVHVTVPRTASRRRAGIRQHTNRLNPKDIKKREGLPVTSVPRTIADVAQAGLTEEHVRAAIKEALQRGLTNKNSLLIEARQRGGRAARLIEGHLTNAGASG